MKINIKQILLEDTRSYNMILPNGNKGKANSSTRYKDAVEDNKLNLNPTKSEKASHNQLNIDKSEAFANRGIKKPGLHNKETKEHKAFPTKVQHNNKSY